MNTPKTYPVKKALEGKTYLAGMKEYREIYEESVTNPGKFWLKAKKDLKATSVV